MELTHYIRIVRRWLWLILLTAFLAGSLTYIMRSREPAVYQTNATIAIGGVVDNPNLDRVELLTAQSLTDTYVRLAQRYSLLEGVVDNLNLEITADDLQGIIQVSSISGTSLLTIRVTYTDPVVAAAIANELVDQLINRSPSNLTQQQQEQVLLLNGQIEILNSDISSLRRELAELDAELELLAADTPQAVIDSLNERRSTVINQINQATSNVANFSSTVADLTGRTNAIELVDAARIPGRPIDSNLLTGVFVTAIFVALVTTGAVVAFEYFNETLRTTDEIATHLGLPTLGVIAAFGNRSEPEYYRLLIRQEPLGSVVDQYHTLRTNLTATHPNQRVFLISSATPQEGKSLTTVNLAMSLAMSGKRVVLIDADLRRPKVHKLLQLDNDIGLGQMLTLSVEEIQQYTYPDPQADAKTNGNHSTARPMQDWRQFAQPTELQNLSVITSGYKIHSPAQSVGAPPMIMWVHNVLLRDPDVDYVFFDTPPCLGIPDSTILANAIGATVILVLEAGRTRRPLAEKSKQRFRQVEVPIAGVVLNKANLREEVYYGYYYGYGDYYRTPRSEDEALPEPTVGVPE